MDNNDDLLAWRMAQLRRQGYTTAARGHGRAGTSSYTVVNSELTTYITGLTTALSDTQLEALDTFISAVKTGMSITALSDAFDVMYILAGETSESSLRNLVKNAHHGTNSGCVFTAFEGFLGNASDAYIDTNFNPFTDGSTYVQNDASFGFYSRTERNASSAKQHGCTDGSAVIRLLPRRSAATIHASINSLGIESVSSASYSTSLGLTCTMRSGASANHISRNKTIEDFTVDSYAPPSANIYLNGYNNNGSLALPDDLQLAFAFMGKNLIQANLNALFDAIETYMDANLKGVV